ncbi:MAG: penicillin-binding protein activator [Gammaproteobacteria bacterium]|jgi:outer membrane PBP1 activator LpoA protein
MTRAALPCSPSLRTVAFALLSAALLAGCATAPQREAATPERAAALAGRGDHAAAALEYDAVAAVAVGVIGNDYRLLAAQQWLAAGRAPEATAALARLAEPLEPAQATARDLFAAEAALLAGDAARAWALLGAMTAPAPDADFDRFHALRQRAALATGRPLEAIASERARETRVTDPARRAALREELLTQLRRASAQGPALDPRSAGRDAVARGWLEAAPLAARAAAAPASSNAAIIAAWKKRYPDHPAGAALAATNIASASASASASAGVAAAAGAAAGAVSGTPGVAGATITPAPATLPPGAHVAALLPLSGRNAAVGAQLRDGLLAAWFAQPAEGRLPLRFYDTVGGAEGTSVVADRLAAARAAGAVSIIGPLLREDVIAAAGAWSSLTADASTRGGGAPTLLALNFLPTEAGAVPAGLLQFGLSPEDEARAIARRASAAGQRRAVALVPAGDWGQRVLRAFREEFEAGGGTLLASRPVQGRDQSAAIRAVLGIDASRARHQRLQSLLGSSLVFQPRRRGDVDVLFLPGQPTQVRQLRAQLKFESAGDIPFYSTADAWDGRADGDLEGMVFPDMPWMVAPAADGVAALRTQSQAAWGDLRGRGRLFALGHDAWLVQEALRTGRLAAGRGEITGVTGALALDDQRRVRRALSWAEIRSSTLRPLDDSP